MSTIDEVIETVRGAREDGPEALAAMALSYGATMALGTLRIRALRGQIAELRVAATAADEMVATLRHERNAACAELKAARESATRAEVWRLRTALDECRTERERVEQERDGCRMSRDHMAEERDRAVQEREAFGLRASAAERERDEARARVEAIAAERNAIVLEMSHTAEALVAARARPTYEPRATAPTPEECAAHLTVGGLWIVSGVTRCEVVRIGGDGAIPAWPQVWIALGRNRLPCAWPVVSEVTP